jgi:two-component system CheB/CheR fusion protein
MQERHTVSQLVVAGSAASGIEALSALVENLPADFPAPLIIAQYLDPHRPSQLADILVQRSTLPVRIVDERESLVPGVVYLLPSNRHAEVTDHSIGLREVDRAHPMPSVDLLLKSVADIFGDGLIAVLLTGAGTDGAAAARAVKSAGGMVVVQNPQTACFVDVAGAIDPSLIDVVADLENIGTLLNDILSGPYSKQQPDQERTLRVLLQQVREATGIDFKSYKETTVLRRLQRRLAATGVATLDGYIQHLQQHPEEYERLVASVLIKVTEFNRDPDLFNTLFSQVLPELVEAGRVRGNVLRIWSAGCATGEEAYSLAILVAEVLGDALEYFTVRIFATDLDNAAIDFARHGTYPPSALAGLPADIIARYFTLVNGNYEVHKRIRNMVVFGQHDLGRRAPFPQIDLCLCRNVLMYFTHELQTRALQLFAFSLRDGGYLVLGKAESTSPLATYFMPVYQHLKVYRRHGERLLIPAVLGWDAGLLRIERAPVPGRQAPVGRDSREAASARATAESARRLLHDLPVGVVVVDQRYDIQLINSMARRSLGVHSPALGEDLLHLIEHLPADNLRQTIDQAIAKQGPSTIDALQVMHATDGNHCYLQLTCSPWTSLIQGSDTLDPTVVIVVSDVTALEVRRQAAEAALVHQRQQRAADTAHREQEQQDIVARQEQEIIELRSECLRQQARLHQLAADNASLIEANELLTSTNLNLRSANEEFQLTGEELQATTAEVETLNEELQATNEELETVNEELQATVEELNATNEDLEARSQELQRQATELEGQRSASFDEQTRLTAILGSMDDAVLLVDPKGRILLKNAATLRIFGGDPAFPMEDASGNPLPADARPCARAARGETFAMQFTHTEPDGARHWYEASGQPIHSGGAERWSVLVIRDITERSLRQLQEEFFAMVSHELQTPLTSLQAGLGLLRTSIGESLTDDEHELMRVVSHNAERLRLQIEDLLAANQLRSGVMQLERSHVDLRTVVANSLSEIQTLVNGKRQPLEILLPTPLPVTGDARRLGQVVINLLANANRHTPPGTRLQVTGNILEGEVRLVVRDFGPGISPARLEDVFDRFKQFGSTLHGSGLGLGIVRAIVELHGGRVWVEQPTDGGAAFHVALPQAVMEESA